MSVIDTCLTYIYLTVCLTYVNVTFLTPFISHRGSVAPQADSSIRPRLYVSYEMCLEPFLRNGSMFCYPTLPLDCLYAVVDVRLFYFLYFSNLPDFLPIWGNLDFGISVSNCLLDFLSFFIICAF